MALQCTDASKYRLKLHLKLTSNIRMQKNVISVTLTLVWLLMPDRLALSISDTGVLLKFWHTGVRRVDAEWWERQETSSEWQFCGRKVDLVVKRDQRRIALLVQDDSNSNSHFTKLYKSISEYPTQQKKTTRTGVWGYSKHRLNEDWKTFCLFWRISDCWCIWRGQNLTSPS